jgi:hypothetical protein
MTLALPLLLMNPNFRLSLMFLALLMLPNFLPSQMNQQSQMFLTNQQFQMPHLNLMNQ